MTRKLFDAFRDELAKDQEKLSSSSSSNDRDAMQSNPVQQEMPAKATSSNSPLKPPQPKRHKRYTFAPL